MTLFLKSTLPIAIFLFLSACNGPTSSEQRLEAVYSAAGNIVGKNTASMFDQAIQSGGYDLVLGHVGRVSVARFKLLTYVAWDIDAADALGGGAVDKIKVIVTAGEAAPNATSANTLVDGGNHSGPALAAFGDRLFLMWSCEERGSSGLSFEPRLCMASTSNGTDWTAPIKKPTPNGQRIMGIDLTEHVGRLFMAGTVQDGSGWRLFAAQVNPTASGNDFGIAAANNDVVPGDRPSNTEGVSLASDGTRLWLGYVQNTLSKITNRDASAWSSSSSLIHDFGPQAGTRPALAAVGNYLYACYRNGSVLTVRQRALDSTDWGPTNLTVNDAQAVASSGIDCHRIEVLSND